jgi:hypothetical protein
LYTKRLQDWYNLNRLQAANLLAPPGRGRLEP